MGLSKEKPKKIWRGLKTLFFLLSMFASLLLFSAPLLIVLADVLIPSAFFTAFLSPSLSIQSLSSYFNNYDFWTSIIDVPLISIARSFVIICVYSFCDGPRLSRGPYLGATTLCCLLSVGVISLKACIYTARINGADTIVSLRHPDPTVQEWWAVQGLFLISLILAVGHILVAYRTSCRERRKLLIYRIDLEAVSACNKGFPTYHKILQHARAM